MGELGNTPSSPPNPFAILGLPPGAPAVEVRARYRELARLYHPDLHAQNRVAELDAEERMKQLNWAYQACMEEAVDNRGATGSPQSPSPEVERLGFCTVHAADIVDRCPSCGRPACPRCRTRTGCRQCTAQRPPAQPPWRRGVPDAVWLWAPVILGTLAFRMLEVPFGVLGWGAIVYLAILGIGVIRRLKAWGWLLWLVFPYSLVLAGVWRLFRSLGGG